MAQFDDLVAKYRNLSYGRLAGTNPSAVNSLLNAQDRGTNSITSPNYFGNIPIEQQQYIETPTGFIGQNQFRIDPNTGIPVFETPTTEAIKKGIEMGGGTAGSGAYDQDVDYGDPGYAGVIPVDPDTGLVGTTTEQQQRGGRDGYRFGKPEPDPTYNPNLLGQYFGYNDPKYAPSPLASADTISDYYSRQQRNVDLDERVATNPETYGYTGPVAKTGLLGFLGNIGKDKVSGKGTKATTEAAAKAAAETEKEITDATKQATKEFQEKQKQKNLDAFNERQKKQQQKEKEGAGPDGPSGGCFVEGTPIQMADGSTKEITNIELGEKTKGGIVEAKMQFLPQNIYNYKDVLVSGSHWVVEDNQLIAVEDSKHGVLTDRIEPVYTFKTSDNRIWINDIEFGDFETGSDEDWEPHFEMVRQKLNKELRDGK